MNKLKKANLPKDSSSVSNLFIEKIDDEYFFTTTPKPYDIFKKYLIDYHSFKDNDEYISILYDFYFNLTTTGLYFEYKQSKYRYEWKISKILPIVSCTRFKTEYWISRGYSEEEAKKIVSKIQSNNSLTLKKCIETYGPDEGKRRYDEYLQKRKVSFEASKANHKPSTPFTKTIDPLTGNFYTGERLKEKISEHNRKAGLAAAEKLRNGEYLTVFQKQFWINKGYSEEDAAQEVYKMMFHNDLKVLIQRYGKEEGTRRYNERITTYKNTCNNKSLEEKLEWNKKKVKVSHKKSKVATHFFQNCLNILKNEYDIILNKVYYDNNEFYIYDEKMHKIYFYDFCVKDLNIIIEFNGIMYHPKPYWSEEKLNSWKSLYFQISGVEQLKKDQRKEFIARNNGFIFLTVWEDENIEIATNKVVNLIKSEYDKQRNKN